MDICWSVVHKSIRKLIQLMPLEPTRAYAEESARSQQKYSRHVPGECQKPEARRVHCKHVPLEVRQNCYSWPPISWRFLSVRGPYQCNMALLLAEDFSMRGPATNGTSMHFANGLDECNMLLEKWQKCFRSASHSPVDIALESDWRLLKLLLESHFKCDWEIVWRLRKCDWEYDWECDWRLW